MFIKKGCENLKLSVNFFIVICVFCFLLVVVFLFCFLICAFGGFIIIFLYFFFITV